MISLSHNLPHLTVSHYARAVFRLRLPNVAFIFAAMVLASAPALAQKKASKPTLISGSEVSLTSVADADWIQGECPESFEPGKVYIFECWATWCGPCIAMIPHVNELYKKYHDKGLRVFGMNVWEDDKDKVKNFVKKKGDQMSYPVAFTGNKSAFDTEWMTASGAKSIPHVFIVRNGKLLVSTQASRLTDSLVETLLSGDEGAKKAADTITLAQSQQGAIDSLIRKFYSARQKSDAKTMMLILKELKGIDPGHPEIPIQELWVLMIEKKWPAAVTILNEMPASESKTSFVSMTGLRTARHSNSNGYPTDFVKALVTSYSDYVLNNESPIGPNHFASLSILQWRIGDKKGAATTAEKGVEAAKNFSRGSESLTKAFERFAKSVDDSTMPTFSDLSKWQREA